MENKYIYIKKENMNYISIVNVENLKNDVFGIIDTLVKLGCDIMGKEDFKRVCNVGDFALIGYDDNFSLLEVVKKEEGNVFLSPNVFVNNMEDAKKWASHLDVNFQKDCKRICNFYDVVQ